MVRFILWLLLSVCALNVRAEPSIDLYRVEVPVANQQEAERVAAAKATLGDVIVNVLAGDTSALQNPMVRDAINNAPNYLLKFTYLSNVEVPSPSPTQSKAVNNGVKLILNYSPLAIEKLLIQAQLIQSQAQQNIVIQVANVQDFTSMKQLQAYLKTLPIIRRVDFFSANKDVVVFNLTVAGDANALANVFEFGKKIQIENNSAISTGTPLLYRWQPSL